MKVGVGALVKNTTKKHERREEGGGGVVYKAITDTYRRG